MLRIDAHDTAAVLYQQISQTSHRGLKREFEEAAVLYAQHRAAWALGSIEERRDIDPARTAAHNALIDTCNILSRAMTRSDEDASWRAALGDDRKNIGDFACHVHCLLSLSAR